MFDDITQPKQIITSKLQNYLSEFLFTVQSKKFLVESLWTMLRSSNQDSLGQWVSSAGPQHKAFLALQPQSAQLKNPPPHSTPLAEGRFLINITMSRQDLSEVLRSRK